MTHWFRKPVLTRSRIWLAFAAAIAADGMQLIFGPLGWFFFDEAIDVVAMLLVSLTLGFHPLFLPTFVVEIVPLVDMLPTWTGCVAAVVAMRRKQPPVPPRLKSSGFEAGKFSRSIDSDALAADDLTMSNLIYPRSPRETMDGWMYLPRYIDKIRLHLAGKLHADYQENLGKGFDGLWLKSAGVTHERMLEAVKNSVTDGEVCDWVRQNVKKTPAEKTAHREDMLSRPPANDAAAVARLKLRKEQSGLSHRDDLKNFVDYIDADEKRI